mmetsp:Transcript_27486/g.48840  ORF Transcript_27486/g.48840 Transcript_27486/m.48840 type:complete len:708 (-) Transcript_27486:156-2279(-)
MATSQRHRHHPVNNPFANRGPRSGAPRVGYADPRYGNSNAHHRRAQKPFFSPLCCIMTVIIGLVVYSSIPSQQPAYEYNALSSSSSLSFAEQQQSKVKAKSPSNEDGSYSLRQQQNIPPEPMEKELEDEQEDHGQPYFGQDVSQYQENRDSGNSEDEKDEPILPDQTGDRDPESPDEKEDPVSPSQEEKSPDEPDDESVDEGNVGRENGVELPSNDREEKKSENVLDEEEQHTLKSDDEKDEKEDNELEESDETKEKENPQDNSEDDDKETVVVVAPAKSQSNETVNNATETSKDEDDEEIVIPSRTRSNATAKDPQGNGEEEEEDVVIPMGARNNVNTMETNETSKEEKEDVDTGNNQTMEESKDMTEDEDEDFEAVLLPMGSRNNATAIVNSTTSTTVDNVTTSTNFTSFEVLDPNSNSSYYKTTGNDTAITFEQDSRENNTEYFAFARVPSNETLKGQNDTAQTDSENLENGIDDIAVPNNGTTSNITDDRHSGRDGMNETSALSLNTTEKEISVGNYTAFMNASSYIANVTNGESAAQALLSTETTSNATSESSSVIVSRNGTNSAIENITETASAKQGQSSHAFNSTFNNDNATTATITSVTATATSRMNGTIIVIHHDDDPSSISLKGGSHDDAKDTSLMSSGTNSSISEQHASIHNTTTNNHSESVVAAVKNSTATSLTSNHTLYSNRTGNLRGSTSTTG